MKTKIKIAGFASVLVLLVTGLAVVNLSVYAADPDVTTTITVDSTGDGSDANIADNICDDGSGNCTLRAAIEESNGTTGTQTIEFAITGTADFTNSGQNGYRISPVTALPQLTDSVEIDGYSQPNSAENTAVSPNPLNGRLLIELDGSSIIPSANGLSIQADDTTIKGLIINDWTFDGIEVQANDAVIQGNYIGTDYSGSAAEPNVERGIAGWGGTGNNALIGGTSPEMRNLISGNGTVPSGAAIGIGTNHDNWTIQGNYIGLAADGVTALPNAQLGGSGNPSIDNVSGTVVGGTDPGAANVISGNNGHGLAPYNAPNTTIQGNFIGTDYTGTVAKGNLGAGIAMSDGCHGSVIGGSASSARNIIANSGGDGIYISESNDVTVQGNHIGTGILGNESFGNGQNAINIDDGSAGVLVGGTTAGASNRIRNSTDQGVRISGALTQVSVIGNSIYDNTGIGIDNDVFGVTANDLGDSDSGSNDNLNFPEYTYAVENGADTEVAYRVDVPAGDYRVEFFENTVADASGYGEGETYLGYHDIQTAGGAQSYVHILPGVTGVTNLAMTITERNTQNASGFGATSEFSSNGTGTPDPTDVSLTKTLTNPEDVAVGATLTYEFALKNEGEGAINLAAFTGDSVGVDNLVMDLLPPDLAYASFSGAGITCFAAPGLVVGFGTFLENHTDHEAVLCNYTGGNQLLAGGDTFTFSIDVTVQPSSDLVFTNIAWVAPQPTSDPDGFNFATAYGSGGDFIDYLGTSVNNVAYASFPLPITPEENSAGQTSISELAKTGLFVIAGVMVGGLLIAAARMTSKTVNNRKYYR